MESLVHVHYREVADNVTTIDYESSETDSSLSGGVYATLGSLATLETSSFMRMVEFDPGLSILGQHIGVTEALAAIGIAGFAYGVDKIRGSIKAIQQQIENSRSHHSPDLSQAKSLSKTLTVQVGNHEGVT